MEDRRDPDSLPEGEKDVDQDEFVTIDEEVDFVEGDDGIVVGDVGEDEELEERMDEVGIEVVGGLGSSKEEEEGEGEACDLEPSDFEKGGKEEEEEEAEEEAEEEDDASLVIRAHTEPVYTVAISPINPLILATGGGDDQAHIWDLSGEGCVDIEGHTDTVASLAFSGDGKLLACGSFDGSISIIDMDAIEMKGKLDGPTDGIQWLSWHPVGHVLLGSSMDGSIWLWNADRLKFMQSFFGHHAPVSCCGFWSSGKMVFSGGEDGDIRTWNPKTGECTGKMSLEDHGGILVMQLSSAKDFLAYAGHADGTIQLINLDTCKVIKEMHHNDSIECIAQSKRHPYVATGSMDSKLSIWDTRTGDFRVMCEHEGETGVVKAVWHPVEPFVFTGATDGLVRKWDARTGTCIAIWRGHSDMILDLKISTNAEILATGSEDHTARVFDLEIHEKQN